MSERIAGRVGILLFHSPCTIISHRSAQISFNKEKENAGKSSDGKRTP